MGSGSSKSRRLEESGGGAACSSSLSPSLSASAGGSRRISRSRSSFRTSCLGLSSRTHDSDDDDEASHHYDEESCGLGLDPRIYRVESEPDDCCQKLKVAPPDEIPCASSNIELGEWGQASGADSITRADDSSTRASSAQSLNRSNRFLSRFSFVPGSVSFRLSRATSIGSEGAYPVSPMCITVSNNEDDLHLCSGCPTGLVNRNENQQASSRHSSSLSGTSPRSGYDDPSVNSQLNNPVSRLPNSSQDCQILSEQDLVEDCDTSMSDALLCSLRSPTETDSLNTRTVDHRTGARESMDRNVRFSRTLSVGRLRGRGLGRSSFSDLAFSPLQHGRELRNTNQNGGRQAHVGETRIVVSDENATSALTSSGYPVSSMSGTLYSSQNNDVDTSQTREARYNDLLEHRSNFLERQRRMRSQVRALQRLGSRFENLSGHERSCILSGEHRTGRCTCHVNTRDSNLNDDSSTRASISRIVMLAEALFEVLDEIHQQSVVLSSQPFVSAIGSVPAPNEVVDSLPVKIYTEPTKFQNEEVSQCYICLVEYEEGDDMRILPCHHEFHRSCVDKWLKEIHRVCPLCRGDICRSDAFSVES